MARDVPPGWLMLQEKAKRAKTPEELNTIIEQMNKLLREHEQWENPTSKPRRKD